MQFIFTQTKDGKCCVQLQIYLRDETGKVSGALCINQDISKFIAAEKAIQGLHNVIVLSKEYG
ncbi:PAS domain-containing protein [Providencia huaxiensis]|uniref:PAS domain-containing protein n=1 Tax=Providencia huaxiensis TaxID=2027290 RepID=UPI0034DD9A34